MSDNSDDSDFSNGAAPTEEDLKMQALLADWDEKDNAAGEFVDSDDEDSDDDDNAINDADRKKALLLRQSSDVDEQEEESSEEEEEVEANSDEEASEEGSEEASEEEASENEEASEEEASEAEASDAEASEAGSDDDGEDEDEDNEEDDPEAEETDDEDGENEDDDIVQPLPAKPTTPTTDLENSDNESVGESIMTSDPTQDKLKKKPKKKAPKKAIKKITEAEEGDTEEDVAMKALLANWDAEAGTADDDDDDDDEENEEAAANDSDSEVEEREVILEDNVIDHLVLAASDLEDGMKEFHDKTGLEPVIAGTIKGLGIKCARISFNDATYLEIIAPDPKGPGPIGELIKKQNFKELTPFHWAIRTKHAEDLKDEVGQYGYTPDHITMFGSKPDGTPRKWEMLYLYGHKMGGTTPFFINWANSDHPCATLPIVGKLRKVTVRAPADDPLHQLLDHVHVKKDLVIEEGKKKFSFSFKCPEGTVKFSTDKAVGFKFPGFEADVGAIPGDDGEQDAEVVFDDPKAPELLEVSCEEYEDLPPPAY